MPFPKKGTKAHKAWLKSRTAAKNGGGDVPHKRRYKRRTPAASPAPSVDHLLERVTAHIPRAAPDLEKVQPHSADGRIRIGTAALLMKQAQALLESISSTLR